MRRRGWKTRRQHHPSKWVESHASASPLRLLEAVACTPIRTYADRNRPQPRRGGARPSASLLALEGRSIVALPRSAQVRTNALISAVTGPLASTLKAASPKPIE